MKQKKQVVITHGDCDGICAAAIAIKQLNNPVIYFAQPFNLCGLLNKFIKTEDCHDIKLYIFDIEGREDNLRSYLGHFGEVVYIDHHNGSMKFKGVYKGRYDIYRSSSQLAADYFNNNDSYLATVGTVCDKMLRLARADKLYKEADLIRKALVYDIRDDDFKLELIGLLSEGKKPSEIQQVLDRAHLAEQAVKQFYIQAELNIIYDHPCIITTLSDSAGYTGTVAAKLVYQYKTTVFLLFADQLNYKIVIVARGNRYDDLDLSEFMKQFDGGGHRLSSAGVLKDTVDIMYAADKVMDEYKRFAKEAGSNGSKY